jgi:hypothetical protein
MIHAIRGPVPQDHGTKDLAQSPVLFQADIVIQRISTRNDRHLFPARAHFCVVRLEPYKRCERAGLSPVESRQIKRDELTPLAKASSMNQSIAVAFKKPFEHNAGDEC